METPIDLYEYGDWKRLPFENETKLNAFKEFLDRLWQNRFRYDADGGGEKSKTQRFLKFDGYSIQARNYTGIICFEGARINIHPKIFRENQTIEPSRYLRHLFYWLSYTDSFKVPYEEAPLNWRDIDSLPEIFFYLFAHYTAVTLSVQPYCAYEELTEETTFLRGRLAMNEYINNQLVTANWHKFTCAHEPFEYNNRFNQIVKYVAGRLLPQLTQNEATKKKLSEIVFLLDEVDDVSCRAEDCDRVNLNRLFEPLQMVLDLCRQFLSLKINDVEDDIQNHWAFLYPMEKVFEEFIGGFLQEHFSEKFSSIEIQKSDLFLAKDEKNNNVFQLRHDIFLTEKVSKKIMILDTKYKIRENADAKGGVSQNDLYQLLSYVIRRKNCTNAALWYPQLDGYETETARKWTIQDELANCPVQIKANNLKISLNEGFEKNCNNEFKNELDKQIKLELDNALGIQADSIN